MMGAPMVVLVGVAAFSLGMLASLLILIFRD